MADYNIAMGVKQPEPVNYLGQMAQIMGIKALQDEMQGSEGVRQAIQSGMSPTDPRMLMYGKRGEAVARAGSAISKEQIDSAVKRYDLMGQVFGYVKNNPTLENAYSAIDSLAQNGVLTPQAAAEAKAQAAADPSKIGEHATRLYTQALSAKEQLPKLETRDFGGSVGVLSIDPVTGQAKQTYTQAKTISPDTAAQVGATIRGQDLTRMTASERLAFEKAKRGVEKIEGGFATTDPYGNFYPVEQYGTVNGPNAPIDNRSAAVLGANALGGVVQPSVNALAPAPTTQAPAAGPTVAAAQAQAARQNMPRPPARAGFTYNAQGQQVPDTAGLFGEKYAGDAAAAAVKSDTALVDRGQTAQKNLTKLYEVRNLLNTGNLNTGFAAEMRNNIDRAKALFGDAEAVKRANDTQLLDAVLGADVFPALGALGLGARNIDTPAERQFLQKVVTGEISMSTDVLKKLTDMRIKLEADAIDKYNSAVDSGRLSNLRPGHTPQRIEMPKAPSDRTVKRTGTFNGRKVVEYSDGTTEYAD